MSVKPVFRLLRLTHWSKSAFVLIGVIYADQWSDLPRAFVAAFAFCLIASAVYIYNDIQDREKDRLHPHKCHRPIANGNISIDMAFFALMMFLMMGLMIGWALSPFLATLLGIYVLLNLAYNHLLKNVPVLDVLTIASGFMLRVLAGTKGIGLPISWWLTFSATLISLFIALCKRRLEKQLTVRGETRFVLKRYNSKILDYLILITAVISFECYLLYTIMAREEAFYFLLTLPFAAIGLWRFAWLSTRQSQMDDPVSLFFQDNLSRFNFLCFLLLTLVALMYD